LVLIIIVEFGIWDLGFGIWDLGFGIWNLEFKFWNLEFFSVILKLKIVEGPSAARKTKPY
jgi:hypothetical protein